MQSLANMENKAQTGEPGPAGNYLVSLLRPRPDALAGFMPLWDARNAAMERLGDLELEGEAAFAKKVAAQDMIDALSKGAQPGNVTELYSDLRQATENLASLVAGIDEHKMLIASLSAQMAPMQESVWTEKIDNVITNLGRNDILDKYFRGAAYTQTMRMGLKGTGTAVAADTQASHASWLEQGLANAPVYTGNRPAITFNAAASQAISHTAQTFAITSGGTVFGCFINNGGSATKDDTTGILFSAGDFTGGSKIVANLDTLSVTYTCNG